MARSGLSLGSNFTDPWAHKSEAEIESNPSVEVSFVKAMRYWGRVNDGGFVAEIDPRYPDVARDDAQWIAPCVLSFVSVRVGRVEVVILEPRHGEAAVDHYYLSGAEGEIAPSQRCDGLADVLGESPARLDAEAFFDELVVFVGHT